MLGSVRVPEVAMAIKVNEADEQEYWRQGLLPDLVQEFIDVHRTSSQLHSCQDVAVAPAKDQDSGQGSTVR